MRLDIRLAHHQFLNIFGELHRIVGKRRFDSQQWNHHQIVDTRNHCSKLHRK
nr:hypothetical protein [Hydrocoleum sp. CS-953]